MNQEYPMWLHIKNIINQKNSIKYDLIVIGDSRAKAGFIPNINKKINSINLSVGGGTPIEGYYILKKFLTNNPAPNNLVLSYGPFHFESADCYWTRTVKFDFLEKKEYQEIEQIATKVNDLETLELEKLSYVDYLNPVKYGDEFKNGILQRRWTKNKDVYLECKLSKGHYYFGKETKADGLNQESKKKAFKESPLVNYYLYKLIDLAIKNNIRVYYYSMPFNQSSFVKTTDTYKRGYNNYIKGVSINRNIKVCNQLNFMTNDNFGDPSHLFKGAEFITRDILKCVYSNTKDNIDSHIANLRKQITDYNLSTLK